MQRSSGGWRCCGLGAAGKVIISEKTFLAKLPDAAAIEVFLLDAPVTKAKQ